MGPIIGGALIGGATSLISNLFGRKNTSDANKANMKIAQMNNQFNAEQAKQNRDWQEKMIGEQNEYNTAVNQRQRLEQAGLNPYMMMNGGSAGSAQGASTTGSQASSVSTPAMQAYRPDFSSLSSSISSVAQARLQSSQANNVDIQNFSLRDKLQAEINKTIGDTDFLKLGKSAQEYYKSMGQQVAQLQIDSLTQQNKNQKIAGTLMDAQTTYQLLRGDAQATINKYLDDQQSLDVLQKSAMYDNLIRDGTLKENQAKLLIAETLVAQARAKGQNISNKIAESTADDLINANNMRNQYDAGYYGALGYGNNAKSMAKMDFQRNKYASEEQRYSAGIRGKDYHSYGLRNSIEYGSKLFQGVGNAIGTVRRFRR